MIPCLNKESLKLLVGTADERYSFSPEYFHETHFPQVMHRYHGNHLTAEVTEMELLDELSTLDVTGNRVFLLFGSTGSGKSELLCWIRDQWVKKENNRPVVRISRSELNPQILIKKCYETFNIPLGIHIDENQWELLQKKPVTLINQMVWSTLAEILESDEEIVPAALLLRHEIEKNIVNFTKQVESGKITTPLEVLYPEQFAELVENTSLSFPIVYESIRQSLVMKLDRFLFEGWDMGSLFKQLSKELIAKNVRPLLLIDDLVQSVNIYANDLLDQLITLEEGNWDVVIGLTPGSLQDSDKGSELTKRIQTLDTIDDRVKKLWLSDETGKVFYNLDRNQSVSYMTKYMYQLKASQGFTCSDKCPHIKDCKNLVVTDRGEIEETDIVLIPFNHSMIRRVYDGIPVGKGKLRYMILYAKEIIRFFQKGDRNRLSRVLPFISRETFAEHGDVFLKTLAEWLTPEHQNTVVLPRALIKNFGYQLQDQTIHLHPLGAATSIDADYEREVPSQVVTVDHLIVRDWVEGKKTNIELLEPVRSGVASLIHDVTKATNLLRPFTPRANSIIQKREVYKGSRYPINFEPAGKAKETEVFVKRGFASLEVSNLHQLKPSDRARKFQKISGEWDTACWVYQSDFLHKSWEGALENALGISLSQFSYMLKFWVNEWIKISKASWVNVQSSPFSKELQEISEQLFQDWFLLRDNMIDPVRPSQNLDFETWLDGITSNKTFEQYQIGSQVSFYTFLFKLKEEFNVYKMALSVCLEERLKVNKELSTYLRSFEEQPFVHFADTLDMFREKLNFEYIDFKTYNELAMKLEQSRIYEKFQVAQEKRKIISEWINKYGDLRRQMIKLVSELVEVNTTPSLDQPIPWLNYEETENLYPKLLDAMTRWNQCLLVTPRGIVREILNPLICSPNVEKVKEQWIKLWEIGQMLLTRKVPEEGFGHLLLAWETIDFHQVKAELTQLNKRTAEVMDIISRIYNDMGWQGNLELKDAIKQINKCTDLRPAIRRHLIQLLENGYSSLPTVQWKKLIEELKIRFPQAFEVIDIKLVVGREN